MELKQRVVKKLKVTDCKIHGSATANTLRQDSVHTSCISRSAWSNLSRILRTSLSFVRSSSLRFDPSLSRWCVCVSYRSASWLSDLYWSRISARSLSCEQYKKKRVKLPDAHVRKFVQKNLIYRINGIQQKHATLRGNWEDRLKIYRRKWECRILERLIRGVKLISRYKYKRDTLFWHDEINSS